MAIRNEEGATVIGRGAVVRGELIATGEIVIEGTVEGSVQAAGTRVTVGREARLRAGIRAQEVVVMGSVEGDIHASERVELRAGALVTGDVVSKRFAMEEDAVLRGAVDPTRVGEAVSAAPVRAAVVEAVPVRSAAVRSAEAPGLFGEASSRQSGQMPAALAAAARGLGTSATPAGLNALAVEGPAAGAEGRKA